MSYTDPDGDPSALQRIAGAVGIAFALMLGVYLLLETFWPVAGLISFSFLLVLPAAVTAFICYVADPYGRKPRSFYMSIPPGLLFLIIMVSFFLLKEGVIRILMLSPLWLASSFVGATIVYRARNRRDGTDRLTCSTLLLMPLIAIQIEPYVPVPETSTEVTRAIVVNAPPARIWPLLRGIPDVRAGEGRWNFTQDVVGVPRPIGAELIGEGIGAERLANWGRDIRFRERVVAWQPGREIGWRFIFDNIEGWRFTDRHLMPDSTYFRVTTGGYRLEPLPGGQTRVILSTSYWIKTPVNAYSKLWGELFLGDVEDNLLALVKQRAEGTPLSGRLASR